MTPLFISANFTCEKEKWNSWVEVFDDELYNCSNTNREFNPTTPTSKDNQRGKKTTMICHCGQEYKAREADLKRGWGKSCSKRCASIRRMYGKN